MEFAKLFPVKKDQVLLVIREDEEDEKAPYKLDQITEIKGIRATVSLCFVEKKDCTTGFKKYALVNALEFHAQVTSMLK